MRLLPLVAAAMLACAPSPLERAQRLAASAPCDPAAVTELARAWLGAQDADGARTTVEAWHRGCRGSAGRATSSCGDAGCALLEAEVGLVRADGGAAAVEAELVARLRSSAAHPAAWRRLAAERRAAGDADADSIRLFAAFLGSPTDVGAGRALASHLDARGDRCGAAVVHDLLGAYAPEHAETARGEVEARLAVGCPDHRPQGRARLDDIRTPLAWLVFQAEVDGVAVTRAGIDSATPVALLSAALDARLPPAADVPVAIRFGPDVRFGRYRRLGEFKTGEFTARSLDAVVLDSLPDDLDLILGRATEMHVRLVPHPGQLELTVLP